MMQSVQLKNSDTEKRDLPYDRTEDFLCLYALAKYTEFKKRMSDALL